jgi:hypothetical protein
MSLFAVGPPSPRKNAKQWVTQPNGTDRLAPEQTSQGTASCDRAHTVEIVRERKISFSKFLKSGSWRTFVIVSHVGDADRIHWLKQLTDNILDHMTAAERRRKIATSGGKLQDDLAH